MSTSHPSIIILSDSKSFTPNKSPNTHHIGSFLGLLISKQQKIAQNVNFFLERSIQDRDMRKNVSEKLSRLKKSIKKPDDAYLMLHSGSSISIAMNL